MEKKQADLLSMLDFNSMSRDDLDRIKSRIDARYQVLKDEAAKKQAIKDNYHIDVPEKDYRPNYYAFYTRVMDLAQHNSELQPDQIFQIDENTQIRISYNYYNMYRCPNCGMFGLAPVACDEHDRTFIIECDCCGFELPKKYEGDYEEDAWRQLHKYLQLHGYLSKALEFPQ